MGQTQSGNDPHKFAEAGPLLKKIQADYGIALVRVVSTVDNTQYQFIDTRGRRITVTVTPDGIRTASLNTHSTLSPENVTPFADLQYIGA